MKFPSGCHRRVKLLKKPLLTVLVMEVDVIKSLGLRDQQAIRWNNIKNNV